MGLMGAVAHTVADGLGEGAVIGVIPEALAPREVGPCAQPACPPARPRSASLPFRQLPPS